MNGRDLNPLLQDPGLAFHRPFSIWAMSGSRCRSPSPLPP
jgi:cytochrome c biogenesis factor